MNLCSDGHDEVCFEVKNCPCCKLIKINIEQEDRIDDLLIEIDNMKSEEQ